MESIHTYPMRVFIWIYMHYDIYVHYDMYDVIFLIGGGAANRFWQNKIAVK